MIVRHLPPAVQEVMVATVIALSDNSVGDGIVGFSLLFFTASRLFAVLRQSVNKIWQSPARILEAGSIHRMGLFSYRSNIVAIASPHTGESRINRWI